MGSFSWIKADELTKVANIVEGKPFKFLIPKEFGGGFIKENYQDYGYLSKKEDGSPKYDIYELFVFWNSDYIYLGKKTKDRLKYNGEYQPMKEIDEYTDNNRGIGIDIFPRQHKHTVYDNFKYPLKLVSASYTGTYEECKGYSYDDPNQGFTPLLRTTYDNYKRRWGY